jgi:Ca2+/H+ antiporter
LFVAAVGPALAALLVLCTITLVLPVFTTSSPEGTCTPSQRAFTGVAVVAAAWLGLPLVLGLAPKDTVMLAMSSLMCGITLASGRTCFMQGAVHLVVLAAFLFVAFVP